MGRRSRKRAIAPGPTQTPLADSDGAAPTRPAAPRRRARRGEAPKPIWAPFPLAELVILLGLGCIAGGVIWGGSQGMTLLVCGVVVVCLAALELAIREHVTGYRSHSALLALVPAAATLGGLVTFVDLPGPPSTERLVALGIAAGVFFICLLALRELFRRRSGGLSFRA